ncbi:MAG: glycosyltransferase family 39 protein [Verrucomicrobiota bacterium]
MPLVAPPNQQAALPSCMPQWERGAMVAVCLLILALKVCYVHELSTNSDESQHLHVAWGWTQGMVQYRDFFDNHTPLFHLAMAPLVAWIGEQADILFRMRLVMLPLFAGALGCIYWLGARLYSQRAGIWAALLAATHPVFLLKSTEFRADILWMALWFATLAVGLTGPFTRRRAFVTGLLLGVVFGVSMKTVLLLVSLLGSLGLLCLLLSKPQRNALLAHSVGAVLPALAGLCIVPLAIGIFFASKGALGDLLYCVFEHNAVPGHNPGTLQRLWLNTLFVILLPVIGLVGRLILRMDPHHPLALQRALVFLASAIFLLLLRCFWPHVTSQDYLPVLPLLAVTITPWVLRLTNRAAPLLLLLATGIQIAIAVQRQSPLSTPEPSLDQALTSHILQLTKPTDFVMDSKGETIFRRRPFRYVLETMTLRRMESGLLPDTIVEEMVKTRTCVVLLKRLPSKSTQWVTKYYVPVTHKIHVTGCFLPVAQEGGGARPFEVAIPAEYVVASAEGSVQGIMDGVACAGPVFLSPGRHTFSSVDSRPLAVFWAQAAATGFTPFQAAQKKD